MPRKPKTPRAIPAELLEQFVNGPMTADSINAAKPAARGHVAQGVVTQRSPPIFDTASTLPMHFHNLARLTQRTSFARRPSAPTLHSPGTLGLAGANNVL